MSNNVRRNASSIEFEEAQAPVSKVTVYDPTTGDKFSKGDNSGRELFIETPYPTQSMANTIYGKAKGYTLQPYQSSGTILDPAIDIGDGVNLDGRYVGVLDMNTDYSGITRSSVSAPGGEEIDHAFPKKSKQQRENERLWGGGGIGGVRDKVDSDIQEVRKEMSVSIDAASSGVLATVKKNLSDGKYLSEVNLWASIGDHASSITLQASTGSRTLAQVVADVIELKGNVKIQDGMLTVERGIVAGGGITAKGNIVANPNYHVTADYLALRDGGYIRITGGGTFKPKDITSTSGTVTVLGA